MDFEKEEIDEPQTIVSKWKEEALAKQKEVKKLLDVEIQKENKGYSSIGYVNFLGVCPENLIHEQPIDKIIREYQDKTDLARKIYLVQPYFFDVGRNWWLWKKLEFCWERVDDTDILNMVSINSNANTVATKSKGEIIEAMKQYGRKHKPKPIQENWIQFKDLIYDIKEGVIRNVSPEYFVTNPIPWELNKEFYKETPVMDRIFEEWVGEDYVKTLYEILAYCLVPDYPIHRIFCFIGGGMNGKSKFLDLLTKFIGERNCATTELDTLLNSRFEITRLHKKLVCQMGETNFNEIGKTSILKKLSGGDLVPFEYKGKDHLQDKNYAKILISTNNLPTTSDKTVGFYRRWMIIDFPNQFCEKKDILAEIPEEEYGCLALKCCHILKDLLEKREFHNEGSIDERMQRYEARSDFLKEFINKFTTNEDVNAYITIADFNKKFTSWCKENRHREMSETSIAMKMKTHGFEQGRKYMDWLFDGKGGHMRVWYGLKWKD